MTKEEIQSKLQTIRNNNALPEKQKGMLIDKYEKMLSEMKGASKQAEPKSEKKTRMPREKKVVKVESEYDCDDLIDEAKERKAKALAAYEKRKNAPKKSAATKSKDAVIKAEKSVEKGVKKGDISVSEIEKIISEYEDAIKKLKVLLEQAKNKMARGGGVDPEEVEHILMKAQGIKEHHCKCHDKMAGGGVVIVKGKDVNGRTFKEEFDSYEDALQQMEGSHYSHLDRDSIRYYDSEGKMIQEQFGNGGGFSSSYYSILGGSHPFSDSAMRNQVVEPNLGSNFETIKMFENNNINNKYDELETKFPRQITNNWKELYRSSSYQGYAKISPDGKVIKAAILDGGGIIGVFYVKSSGQKRKMANGGGVDGLKRFDVDFYDSSDANRDSSIEIIIRQNSLENAIEMAIKKAYDFQKNYIEFYHKNLFLGSVNFATSEQFRKGKDYDKFMSNDKYAKGGAIQIGSWVQEKKGNARGQVYEMEGEFVKLQDKYGNKSDKLFRISDFKKSSRPRYERGGVVGQEVVIDYQGDEKRGYIKEVTDSGDYIVNTDDGRTVFAQKDIDLISLGGMHKFAPKPKQKRFGFFDHGGSMSDQGM
jgi:hypothetical protein